MLSDSATDIVSVEFENGLAIEYTRAFMEEVRQHAISGFVAFGRGGLEIGGVLYGRRDGDRVGIDSLAEFPCEHARGPGFLLSDKDRVAFLPYLAPPPGLETLGWFRAHTRKGVDLDAGDRELFDQFSPNQRVLALVLKPAPVGPSSAAFYVRETNGEILSQGPAGFAVEPAERCVHESPQPAVLDLTPVPSCEPQQRMSLVPKALHEPSRKKHGWAMALGAAAALAIVGLWGLWAYGRSRPPHKLDLQAYSIAPGQVRIAWNHDSLPAMKGESGIVEIRDGTDDTRIPLTARQLRLSSITYLQKTDRVQVTLRVDRSGAEPAEEWIEFLGPAGKFAAAAPLDVAVNAQDPPVPRALAPSHPPATLAPPKVRYELSEALPPASALTKPNPPEADLPKRRFQLPVEHKTAAAPAVADLPAAPPAVAPVAPQQAALPDFLSKVPIIPRPAPQPGTVPRSGRLIWTGKLGRHETVEIEGGRASVGSVNGSLWGVPADFQIAPAEFTKDGLAIYTMDGAAHGRMEPPSKSNGWNSVVFEFDPVRIKELVVVEAPSRLNSFSKIILRNEARTCPVIVVDWTAR
jgi:hypothetical protein